MLTFHRHRLWTGLLTLLLLTGFVGLSPAVAGGIAFFDFREVAQVHPAIQEFQTQMQQEQTRIMEEMEGMSQEEQMMQQQVIQQQLEAIQHELLDEAITKIENDIQILADELEYDYVLDKDVIFAGGHDITEEVFNFIQEKYEIETGQDFLN